MFTSEIAFSQREAFVDGEPGDALLHRAIGCVAREIEMNPEVTVVTGGPPQSNYRQQAEDLRNARGLEAFFTENDIPTSSIL